MRSMSRVLAQKVMPGSPPSVRVVGAPRVLFQTSPRATLQASFSEERSLRSLSPSRRLQASPATSQSSRHGEMGQSANLLPLSEQPAEPNRELVVGGPAALYELLTVPQTSVSCSWGHTPCKAKAILENSRTSWGQRQALIS